MTALLLYTIYAPTTNVSSAVTATFPFHLYFTEEGTTYQASTEIQFPIINGERNIIITHSPGCVKNSYTYVFKKISEN